MIRNHIMSQEAERREEAIVSPPALSPCASSHIANHPGSYCPILLLPLAINFRPPCCCPPSPLLPPQAQDAFLRERLRRWNHVRKQHLQPQMQPILFNTKISSPSPNQCFATLLSPFPPRFIHSHPPSHFFATRRTWQTTRL